MRETEVVLIFKLCSFETSFINFACSRHSCLRSAFVRASTLPPAASPEAYCNISSFWHFFSSSCFNVRILNVRKDSLMESKPLEGEIKCTFQGNLLLRIVSCRLQVTVLELLARCGLAGIKTVMSYTKAKLCSLKNAETVEFYASLWAPKPLRNQWKCSSKIHVFFLLRIWRLLWF